MSRSTPTREKFFGRVAHVRRSFVRLRYGTDRDRHRQLELPLNRGCTPGIFHRRSALQQLGVPATACDVAAPRLVPAQRAQATRELRKIELSSDSQHYRGASASPKRAHCDDGRSGAAHGSDRAAGRAGRRRGRARREPAAGAACVAAGPASRGGRQGAAGGNRLYRSLVASPRRDRRFQDLLWIPRFAFTPRMLTRIAISSSSGHFADPPPGTLPICRLPTITWLVTIRASDAEMEGSSLPLEQQLSASRGSSR